MEATAEKLLHAKEFARQAGVTVRTLHVYDRLGLLEPAARTDSGYRLYGEEQLERLEQILALRFVGFRLEHIKELLRGSKWPLIVALRMQRQIVAQEKRRLEHALAAIEEAERAIQESDSDRWQTLRNVIGALKMKNDWNWTQNYYSPEAREKVAERMKTTPQEATEQGQRDWTALLADVEEAASRGEDPQSEHAQSLVQRWRGLLHQFTGGDPGIQQGLNKLWSDRTHWPADFKRPWSDAADAWIKRAMNCSG
jgi:MerR family transcriptional regulator, thiopeptide resistance regulator